MKSITLGRYSPYNTFIHRMDARNKVICLIALMVAIFMQYNNWPTTFIVGGALFVLITTILLLSRVSLKDIFKSLRVLWFLIIILLLINVLIPSNTSGPVAFSIGSLPVYWDSIFQSLKVILRLVMMIEATMVLTATTKPLDLTYALEWFMTPLKVIKFPAHEVAMVISIALRFIPTLLDETERLMKAQSSRGVDFAHGKLSTRIKAIISLIIPLFISAFQRSEELADSMEARGYNPRGKRTKYRLLKFHFRDIIGLFFVCAVLATTITIATLGI